MEDIQKRKDELDSIMGEFDESAQKAWMRIAKLENNQSLRASEKIDQIKDIIMQEVSYNDN